MTVVAREKKKGGGGDIFASIYVLGSSGRFSVYEESHVTASVFGPSSPLRCRTGVVGASVLDFVVLW